MNNPPNSDNTPRSASISPVFSVDSPSKSSERGESEGIKQGNHNLLAYFERISKMTGSQMQSLLYRTGIKLSRLSLDLNYNEAYLRQTLAVTYPAKPLPWRIIAMIRNKIGDTIFDTAFAEAFDGLTVHPLRVTGRELREIILAAGSNLMSLSKKMGVTRTALRQRIIRNYMTPVPIDFVSQIRNALGEVAFDLMYLRVVNQGGKGEHPKN